MSSALTRFHEDASDALSKLSDRLPAGTKLCLVAYAPGNSEMDIVLKDNGLSVDEVLSTLRRRGGLSIDGDNAYKRDLCDSIIGSMIFGFQDRCPPPPEHWAQRFWDIGRAEGTQKEELISALDLVTSCLSQALTGGAVPAAKAGQALVNAAEVIARATGTTLPNPA